MTEKVFKSQAALAAYAAQASLDFEPGHPLPVEREALYSRYTFVRNGLIVGYGVIDPGAEDDEPELVLFTDRCPCCGERRVDHLVWIDDETVECTTCGAWYDPGEKEA